MSTSPEKFTHLVEQVQIAHRLCVGFYQRLLPGVDEIARAIDCVFRAWGPIETSRPASRSTSPTNNKWAWDLVPMFATQFDYARESGGTARAGDLMLSFVIYIDENFSKKRRVELNVRGQPDPIKLERGDATVQVRLFRCTADSNKTLDSLIEDEIQVQAGSTGWLRLSDKLEAVHLRYALANFIADTDKVVSELKTLVGGPPDVVQTR